MVSGLLACLVNGHWRNILVGFGLIDHSESVWFRRPTKFRFVGEKVLKVNSFGPSPK
jgi:hypothetical protein